MKTKPTLDTLHKDVKLPEHHKTALVNLYKENNVSHLLKDRLKFWKDDECYISHNPTKKQRVALHEKLWLLDNFPQDFEFY